ncbi:MAG: hypothetical protein IPM61_13350 [Chlorobi bacterium]|nr:hypothetical protein [Chlorobiota bacterium]
MLANLVLNLNPDFFTAGEILPFGRVAVRSTRTKNSSPTVRVRTSRVMARGEDVVRLACSVVSGGVVVCCGLLHPAPQISASATAAAQEAAR